MFGHDCPVSLRLFKVVFAIAFVAGLGSQPSTLHGQLAPTKQENGAVVYPRGAEQITEGRVTSTISFLASDELAGRETNSKEFEIAAAYVASRFRGAGLEVGGVEGSYYHETVVNQTRVPSEVVLENTDKSPIAHFGLLATGDEAFEWSGKVVDVSLDALQNPDTKLEDMKGVVRGRFDMTAKGSRALGQLLRLTQRLQAAGVQALLLDSEIDSEWVRQAELLRVRPRVVGNKGERGGSGDLPIILISPATKLNGEIHLRTPAILREEKKMRNVIGLMRGTDESLRGEAVLYSAHLDHLGSNPKLPEDSIFNGADDDASGVTAVLTLADAIGAMETKPKRSVLFMTFWGEESGLLGSKQFVSTPSWPLEKIVANINIEMIGRPEGGARGKIWMTGWRESNLGTLMASSASPWGTEIFEHPKFSSMLYRASDNWSFAERGVVAHSFSAGSLHPDYHQVDDEWDRLEIPHMTSVIRGLWLASFPLLDGTQKPTKGEPTGP